MKLQVVLILGFLMQSYAIVSQAQTGRLNLQFDNNSLKEVLQILEDQTDFSFVYKDELINSGSKITGSFKDKEITEVLENILRDRNLTYMIKGKAVVILPTDQEIAVRQQKSNVKGTITDSSGAPLPGVTIVIKGTTQGTISDSQGNYSLAGVPGNATLVFSFVGMKTQEVKVAEKTSINIKMEDETVGIDEVVAVGYGTMKKANITGAIAQYSAENLNERPVQRLDQALVGQMAGVRVKQTSGLPAKGLSIQVRGSGSISASAEPLYVIDGFPIEVSAQNSSGSFTTGNALDNINPNDIESIQVLKDASSAAIYGSRAANGVVLITTKRGKTGKAKINFNVYTGWNEAVRKLEMLNGEQYIERAMECINYNYLTSDPGNQNRKITDDYDTRLQNVGYFDNGSIFDPRWLEDGYPGVTFINWQDEIFRKGMVQDYQLSATGGNEYVHYFISGDFMDQESYALGVDYKRYSVRTNIEVKPNSKLTAGINLAPSYSEGNDPGFEGKDSQLHAAASMPPVTDSAIGINNNTGDYNVYTFAPYTRNSPVRVLQNTTGLTKIFRTLTTVYADYEIIKGMNAKTTFNLDNTDQSYKYYRPAWVSGTLGSRTASGNYSGYKKMIYVNENTLSYNGKFNEKHHVSAVAGISYSSTNIDYQKITASGGFSTDYISTLNDAVSIVSSSTSTYTTETKSILLSYFGRVNYDYLSRYLLSVSIRRDGSSRFGNDTKWGFFPSVSAGWRISDEGFMKNIKWLNTLKLRCSWGISGNNSLGGDYEHIALLQSANYSFNKTKVTGQASKNFANSDLSWEEAEMYNYGVDFGIFDNRLYGSFEYYTKINSDLLLSVAVPAASGYSTALTNIGEVFNKGWELELNTRNLTGTFSWETRFNLSFNTNEVRKLGPNNTPILSGSFGENHNITMIGKPMYSIYVIQTDGILTQADIDAGAALYGNQTEGDRKYMDAKKDGVINSNDRVICGHPNPDYIWGITNTFTYKGFDLSIFVQGQNGGKIYSLFGRAVDRTGMGFSENSIAVNDNRWRSSENPGSGKRGKAYASNFGWLKSTDWLYSNDYWSIRNITLGYNLGKLIKSNLISGARVYVTAENWFGHDKYTGGWNPEAINTSGDDYGGAPLAKSMIFGLNITF